MKASTDMNASELWLDSPWPASDEDVEVRQANVVYSVLSVAANQEVLKIVI